MDALQTSWRAIVAVVVMAAVFFAFDLSMPLGIAGGVPYAALVLVGIWFPTRGHVLWLAVLGSALTILGFYFSPDGGTLWVVLTNRGLALFVIWLTAILVIVRKADEAALVLAKTAAEHAQAEAETANAGKSRFLSSMSHELRTPLNAILGFGQILDDPKNPLNANQSEYVRYILNGGEHLLSLINEIMDLSMIEAGKMPIEIEEVSCRRVVEPCVVMAKTLGDRLDVVVENRIDMASAPVILADVTRCTQVLLNLLTNAVKYNKPGGHVTLDCSVRDGGWVRFSVTDTGVGVPKDEFDRVFLPFERLSNAQDSTAVLHSEDSGAGIGLAVSKELVTLMGGHIGVESTQDEGSTFWFELPVGTQDVPPVEDGFFLAEADGIEIPSLTREATILYVEDNFTNLELMRSILRRVPNVVLRSAITAEEGLEMAMAAPPDVVLMDINLPGMNGLDACRALKRENTTMHIPVIAVTADATLQKMENLPKIGFEAIIVKPYTVEQILAVISNVFDEPVKALPQGVWFGGDDSDAAVAETL